MMDRRGFLRMIGAGLAAAAAATKTYVFLGGILRPRVLYEHRLIGPMIEDLNKVNPYVECFEWKVSLGSPVFRLTDLKVEVGPGGQVISWAPTEKTRLMRSGNEIDSGD